MNDHIRGFYIALYSQYVPPVVMKIVQEEKFELIRIELEARPKKAFDSKQYFYLTKNAFVSRWLM